MTIDGKMVGNEVDPVDNFDELYQICRQFLESEEIKEINLRSQFERIAKKWDVNSYYHKAGSIVEEISDKLEEQQKKLYLLKNEVSCLDV